MNVSFSNIMEIRWPRKMQENFMSWENMTLEGTFALAGIAQWLSGTWLPCEYIIPAPLTAMAAWLSAWEEAVQLDHF